MAEGGTEVEFGTGGSGRTRWALDGAPVPSQLCSHHVPSVPIREHSPVCHTTEALVPGADASTWPQTSGSLADTSFSAMFSHAALRDGREASQHPRCPRPAAVLFYARIGKTCSDPWCVLLCRRQPQHGVGTVAPAASGSHRSRAFFLPCLFEEGGAGQARHPFNF